MTRLVYSVVIVITVFVGLTFTYMNNQPVQLRYLGFEAELNLSLLLLCTLVIGVVTGYLASWLSSFRLRRNLSRTKRELKSARAVTPS